MRRLLVFLVFVLSLPFGVAQADYSQSYDIYPSGQPVVPVYRVRPRPDGSLGVYDANQFVVPKYIVTPQPDGTYKVYPSGKPVIPETVANPFNKKENK